MKSIALLLAAFLLAAPLLLAQETYGTIKATTRLLGDGTKSTTIVDPDAHTSEETILDAGNKVLKKTTYLLGDHDLPVAAIFRDAKGKIIYKASYQRDDAQRVIEASFTAPDGSYLGKRVFVYGAGQTTGQVIDYDANGQQIMQAQAVAPKSSKKKH